MGDTSGGVNTRSGKRGGSSTGFQVPPKKSANSNQGVGNSRNTPTPSQIPKAIDNNFTATLPSSNFYNLLAGRNDDVDMTNGANTSLSNTNAINAASTTTARPQKTPQL